MANSKSKQAIIDTGICGDGKPCGYPYHCYGCPNDPQQTALNTQTSTENDFQALFFQHENQSEQPLDMGTKHDSAKPRMDLIPPTAEILLAHVLTYGAKKYAPDNWRKIPEAQSRYIAAAMRHINAHRSGEVLDPESGLPHLAHAMCSIAFILELDYE